jgi:hypothetical protein
LPSGIITVPCCRKCNGDFGKIDEYVRNIIISLDVTENHPAIKSDLGEKRNRAFQQKYGKLKLHKLVNNSTIVDKITPGGIFLGKASAFYMDTKEFDRFIERTTRALIHYELSMGFFECTITWGKANSFNEAIPPDSPLRLIKPITCVIGDNIFRYDGFTYPGSLTSLWLLTFYDGITFTVSVVEKASSSLG